MKIKGLEKRIVKLEKAAVLIKVTLLSNEEILINTDTIAKVTREYQRHYKPSSTQTHIYMKKDSIIYIVHDSPGEIQRLIKEAKA